MPFDFEDDHIDPHHVLWYEDFCYKKGRRADGGHRIRRAFELIKLDTINQKKILDVGCGNGPYSVFFALLGAEAYGIDISPVAIQNGQRIAKANQVDSSCFFSIQNIAHTNFPNEFFDVIIYNDSFHHVAKYPHFREETYRILKPDGLVIILDGLNGNFIFRIARRITMRGKEDLGDIPLSLSTYNQFASDYREHQIEMMSLLFMSKRIFRSHLCYSPIRWLLFISKKMDDFLLFYFPFLNRYCGECVITLRK